MQIQILPGYPSTLWDDPVFLHLQNNLEGSKINNNEHFEWYLCSLLFNVTYFRHSACIFLALYVAYKRVCTHNLGILCGFLFYLKFRNQLYAVPSHEPIR